MLKQRALIATLWSGADIIVRQGVQFGLAIALARLLSPADFGTMALLSLFLGVSGVFMDGGFSAALIQCQDVDHADESTVFWFNLAAGVTAGLGLCMAASAIADFYALPILKPLTAVMSLNVMVGSLGAVHSTLLNKRLDFRTLMKVGIAASLLSGGVALLAAWRGCGVWALALQSLVMTGVTTGLLWLLDSWRPGWLFSVASVRKLAGFGVFHFASSLLEIIYGRLHTILIGRFFGTRELGLYSNADAMKQMPVTFLTGVLARVIFPVFSVKASDREVLRRGLQFSIRGMMLINAPMMIGILMLAEPLVRVLFGIQWLMAVPILRTLCFVGLLYPLHVVNLQALMAQGHSRLMFRVEIVKKVLGVALIVAGMRYGVMGVAGSQAILSALALYINAHYSKRFFGYGALAQVRDVFPLLGPALAMITVVYLLHLYWPISTLVGLIGAGISGATVFFALAWLMRLNAFTDVASLLQSPSFGAQDPGDLGGEAEASRERHV